MELSVEFKFDDLDRYPLRWVNGVRYWSGHLQGMERYGSMTGLYMLGWQLPFLRLVSQHCPHLPVLR